MVDAVKVKDYLSSETVRNKQHASTYERFLKAALPERRLSVFVGHHISFEIDGDLSTENEIPSADCLMFDHELMGTVFGQHNGVAIMRDLAGYNCDERDARFKFWLDAYHIGYRGQDLNTTGD